MPILDNITINQPFANLAGLKALDTTPLSDNVLAFVKTLGLYRFNNVSSATADDNIIIQPTTGPGRWIKLTTNQIPQGVNIFTSTSRTLASGDENYSQVYNNTLPLTVTVPNDTTDNIQIGAQINFYAENTGTIAFVAEAGVALLSNSIDRVTYVEGDQATLKKIAANTWMLEIFASMATQDRLSVEISGGTINGTAIGNSIPSTFIGTTSDILINASSIQYFFNAENINNASDTFRFNKATSPNSTPTQTPYCWTEVVINNRTAGAETCYWDVSTIYNGAYVQAFRVDGSGTTSYGGMTATATGLITQSVSGSTTTLTARNTSNTASSAANIISSVAGALAGDPTFQSTTTANTWTWGADNSDSDSFVLARGTALGTNNVIHATLSGELNYPSQPLFSAVLSTTQSNVTGDGTVYTIVCDTELKDQGSIYNNTTGIFTAPVTGNYLFCAGVLTVNGSAFTTYSNAQIVCTSHTWTTYLAETLASTGAFCGTISAIVPMTAGDTARLKVVITNSGGTADVYGDGEGNTFFSGQLIS